MKILCFDPAASTGFCVVDVVDTVMTILEYGFIDIDVTSEYDGDRCNDFMNIVTELITTRKPDEITVEDYFFGKRFATGSNINVAYRTVVHMVSRIFKLHYAVLNISEWKKHIAGSAVPSKLQKKKWGKNVAKKLFIQEALWKKFNIRFPNHSISEKNGKPIKFRNDIVDVIAQAIFYCETKYGVKEIRMDVELTADVEMKKKSKWHFNYEEGETHEH